MLRSSIGQYFQNKYYNIKSFKCHFQVSDSLQSVQWRINHIWITCISSSFGTSRIFCKIKTQQLRTSFHDPGLLSRVLAASHQQFHQQSCIEVGQFQTHLHGYQSQNFRVFILKRLKNIFDSSSQSLSVPATSRNRHFKNRVRVSSVHHGITFEKQASKVCLLGLKEKC